MMPSSSDFLCPQSCRAARNLLGLTQAEFAALARISVSTLRRFEAGEGKPSAYAARQIHEELVREGILFVGPARVSSLR
jgi:transcriptional regulator with XRE-family HTH domain